MTETMQDLQINRQALGLTRDDTPTPWITVTGGKGGVGKTLIAVNLAVLISRAGYRTLLVDLDAGLPNIDVHLRLAPKWTLEDVVLGVCRPEQALCDGPHGLSVLCGRSGSTLLADKDAPLPSVVLEAVHATASGFDVVICDTGSGIGPLVLEAANQASVVLAVTTPDPAAVTDTYALCKLLMTRQIAEPHTIVNRVRSRDEAMRTGSRLRTVCKKFLQRDLAIAGWLRTEQKLENSIAEQRPFAVGGSGPVLEDLRALSATALSALPALKRRRVNP